MDGLLKIVATAHPLNAALGVHNPLFAGVEGMTIATHFNSKGGLGRSSVEHVAAGAGYRGIIEIGVNVCFHAW